MKKKKEKLKLETFKISKLTNLTTIIGGDQDETELTIKLSTRDCKD